MSVSPERRARLAKVHVARMHLALTDDSYRDLLARVTGMRSAGDCTDAQLDLALAEFKRLGWEAEKTFRTPKSEKAYVRMIYGMWKDLKPYVADHSVKALRSFVRRQTGASAPEFLSPEDGNDVIEGLKSWLKREQAKAGVKATSYVSANMRRRHERGEERLD